MKREILCGECAKKTRPMHPADLSAGFKRRTVELRAKKPKDLAVTINGVVHSLRSMMCDSCGLPVLDGAQVAAVTWWNTNHESEPGPWETEYLTPEP